MDYFKTPISPETFLTSCQRSCASVGVNRTGEEFPSSFLSPVERLSESDSQPERNSKTNPSGSTISQISSISNSDSLVLKCRTLSSKYFLTIDVHCWEEKTVLFDIVVKTSSSKWQLNWWFLKMISCINVESKKKAFFMTKSLIQTNIQLKQKILLPLDLGIHFSTILLFSLLLLHSLLQVFAWSQRSQNFLVQHNDKLMFREIMLYSFTLTALNKLKNMEKYRSRDEYKGIFKALNFPWVLLNSLLGKGMGHV